MPTREQYLTALAIAIRQQGHEWLDAPDPKQPDRTKFDKFMALARETIETNRNVVCIDTPSFVAAWKACGLKGKPTYKGLRALPAA